MGLKSLIGTLDGRRLSVLSSNPTCSTWKSKALSGTYSRFKPTKNGMGTKRFLKALLHPASTPSPPPTAEGPFSTSLAAETFSLILSLSSIERIPTTVAGCPRVDNRRWTGDDMLMNFKFRPFRLFTLLFIVFATAPTLLAQRLHDAARDTEAQKARQLAEDIVSKSSFEKQLKNLELLANRDIEVYFTGAKRQMGLDIRTFRTWGAVALFVDDVKTTLNTPDVISNDEAKAIAADLELVCDRRNTELGQAVCTAKAKLKELKDAVDASEAAGKVLDEELKTRLEKIAVIESLLTKTKSFLKSNSKNNSTLKDTSDVFIHLANTYVNYVNKLALIRNQPSNELRLLLQRIAVEALLLEVDYWQTVGEITLRRADEQKDLRNLVSDVEFRLAQTSRCFSTDQASLFNEKINVTFARAQALPKCTIFDGSEKKDTEIPKEEIVAYLFQTLYSTAALAARGKTPMKLAELRLAHESHRFSIRQSAVMARTYEVVLTSGTKRLGRFYAGGLKPEKIAELIYTAATVAIPTVIATK
jgi:hypothetical protein